VVAEGSRLRAFGQTSALAKRPLIEAKGVAHTSPGATPWEKRTRILLQANSLPHMSRNIQTNSQDPFGSGYGTATRWPSNSGGLKQG
jgi:hypothetical protein